MRASLALAAASSVLTNCGQVPKANPNFVQTAKQYAVLPDNCLEAEVSHSENVSSDNFSGGTLFKAQVSNECRTSWISALAESGSFKCLNSVDIPLDPQLAFVFCITGNDLAKITTTVMFKSADVEFLRVIPL